MKSGKSRSRQNFCWGKDYRLSNRYNNPHVYLQYSGTSFVKHRDRITTRRHYHRTIYLTQPTCERHQLAIDRTTHERHGPTPITIRGKHKISFGDRVRHRGSAVTIAPIAILGATGLATQCAWKGRSEGRQRSPSWTCYGTGPGRATPPKHAGCKRNLDFSVMGNARINGKS